MTRITVPRPKPPSEKAEQKSIIYAVRVLGGHVASTSQYRASRVALGLPDLLIAFPAKGVAFFFEVKGRLRRKGADDDPLKPLRPEQARWRETYERCGWKYYWGDYACLVAALHELGIVEHDGTANALTRRMEESMRERRDFLAALHQHPNGGAP